MTEVNEFLISQAASAAADTAKQAIVIYMGANGRVSYISHGTLLSEMLGLLDLVVILARARANDSVRDVPSAGKIDHLVATATKVN